MIALLLSVKWHLIVALNYISLVTSAVEHVFMCLLVIFIFGEMSIQVLCSFLNWLVVVGAQKFLKYSAY